MSKLVSGLDEIKTNLVKRQSAYHRKVVKAIGISCTDIANHAKAGHEGAMAHANDRYQNQTTNLTRNIQPGPVVVQGKKIIGRVDAKTDYAAKVEARYPYVVPALEANREPHKQRMKDVKI